MSRPPALCFLVRRASFGGGGCATLGATINEPRMRQHETMKKKSTKDQHCSLTKENKTSKPNVTKMQKQKTHYLSGKQL